MDQIKSNFVSEMDDAAHTIMANGLQDYEANPEINKEVQDVIAQPELQKAVATELSGQSEDADIKVCVKESEANKVNTYSISLVGADSLKIITRFKNAFRQQSNSERKQLEDSIKEYEITTPIKVWKRPTDSAYEYIIIDGHNRYEVAKELCLESIPIQFAEFDSEDDAYLFIINEQLGRRNLNPAEFHDLLSIKKQLIQQKPTFNGNQHTEVERQNDASPKGKAAQQVADENGVSASTVERADKARRDAITNLKNPGLATSKEMEEQILKGQIKASTKDMETLATLNHEATLDIFNTMIETKVLTIPDEAMKQSEEPNPMGKTEQQKEATRKAINKVKESCGLDLFGDCEEKIINGDLIAADKDISSLASMSVRNRKDIVANLKATGFLVFPTYSSMFVDEYEKELLSLVPNTKTLMELIEQFKTTAVELEDTDSIYDDLSPSIKEYLGIEHNPKFKLGKKTPSIDSLISSCEEWADEIQGFMDEHQGIDNLDIFQALHDELIEAQGRFKELVENREQTPVNNGDYETKDEICSDFEFIGYM